MTDREFIKAELQKLQKILEAKSDMYISNDKWDKSKELLSFALACSGAIELLEAKPPIHIHEEYPEHDWETDEKGEVDVCAWGQEYCNGPMCKRCYYAFCINCEPNGWNKKPCIVDFFKCPNCGEKISKNTKFCDNCGQAVKWE